MNFLGGIYDFLDANRENISVDIFKDAVRITVKGDTIKLIEKIFN